jgi:hypothetical protein
MTILLPIAVVKLTSLPWKAYTKWFPLGLLERIGGGNPPPSAAWSQHPANPAMR